MENPYSSPGPTGPLALPDRMEVSFVQTADDLAAFNLHYYSTSGAIRARRWLMPAFLFGVCSWMLATSYSRGTPLIDMAPFIGMMIFLGIVGVLMTRRRIRRFAHKMYAEKPQPGILGEIKITIEPGGISTENPYRRSWVSWAAIGQIARTADHLFIYHGTASAFAIPRSAFGNEAVLNQFAGLAEKFRGDMKE